MTQRTKRPKPLAPLDADMRRQDHLPINVDDLDDLLSKCDDREIAATMRLWWAAWRQVPAGSLPNDDRALAQLAGFGHDTELWQGLRERLLYGYQLCSDGRLYEINLAEIARSKHIIRLKRVRAGNTPKATSRPAKAKAPNGKYAFEGQIIRLIAPDLEKWRAAYHAIPDLSATLQSIDDFYAAELAKAKEQGKQAFERALKELKRSWFRRTSRNLEKRHNEILESAQADTFKPIDRASAEKARELNRKAIDEAVAG